MQESSHIVEFPRLHKDVGEVNIELSNLGIPAFEAAIDAIAKLTGYSVEFDSTGPHPDAIWSTSLESGNDENSFLESGGSDLRLSIVPGSQCDRADLQLTKQLVDAIGELVGHVLQTQNALANRESELAAGIPVVATKDDAAHLQSRLQSVLRGLCEGIGCQAAAVYLLDDATTVLKLRSQWGLPNLRFVNPARPLRGSVADLEALTGHAVVIEDVSLLPQWKVPEDHFDAAVCVPISSPTTILGTLWVYCEQVRDFTPAETNLIEIIAGRVSVELERTVLLEETQQNKHLKQREEAIEIWQLERHLLVPPILEGWEVAGARGDGSIHNDFYHWRMFDEDQIGIATAGVTGASGASFLSATALQSALQTQLLNESCPQLVIEYLNEFSWANSPGDSCASMFYGLLDLKQSEIAFSMAGTSDAFVLRPHGWEPLATETLMLGIDPDVRYEKEIVSISKGDVIFAVSERHWNGDDMDTISIAEYLLGHTHRSAREIAELALERLTKNSLSQRSPGVIVVKRYE